MSRGWRAVLLENEPRPRAVPGRCAANVRSSSSTRTTAASMRILGVIAIATLSALAPAACAPADDGDAAPADPGTLQTVTEGVLTIDTWLIATAKDFSPGAMIWSK